MGDMSKEPSMEEILSSIKRIIAEDHDGADRAAPRREARATAGHAATREQRRKAVVAGLAAGDAGYADEVLELTEEVPLEDELDEADQGSIHAMEQPEVRVPAPKRRAHAAAEGSPVRTKKPVAPVVTEADDEADEDMIVSAESEMAARSSLAALSSMVVHSAAAPEEANTLEGLVREMLRPMLKQWLDANLPSMVEGMVAKEIARITGRAL